MARTAVLWCLLGLLGAETLHAEAPPDALSLLEVTEQLLSEAPRAQAARLHVLKAHAQVTEAGLRSNPTLELQHGQFMEQVEQTATLGVTLPISGRRSAQVQAARAGLRGAEAETQQVLASLLSVAQRQYFELLLVQEARSQIQSLLQEVSRLEAIAQRRAERGQISGFDSLRLQSQGDLLRSQRAGLEVRLAQAGAELAALLGRSAPVAASGRLTEALPLPEAHELLAQAGRQGALAGARARIDQAQLQVRAARLQTLPEPILQGGLWRLKEGTSDGLGFVAGLSLPLPLLDRGQASRAYAQAELRAQELEVQALTAELQARIAGGHQAAQAAQARAQVLEAESIPRVQKVLEQAAMAYEAGEVPLTTLLETLLAAQEIRTEALEAHHQARLAELAVREAAGLLPTQPDHSGGRQ